jgi:signal peptidase I
MTDAPPPDEPTPQEPPLKAPPLQEPTPEKSTPREPVASAPGGGVDAEGEGESSPSSTPSRAAPWVRTGIEWAVVLLVALVIALLVRTYVIQTYYIPSISMEPTLQVGDHILVLKAAYRFTSPAIGDVIVFKAPPKEHLACQDPEVQDLVKRIIALPNDTIRSVGNNIYINNHLLAQPWQHTMNIGSAIPTQTIPPNRYFVMGDNRPESCDSRVWGTVPRGNIIGKAVLIFWPLSRFSKI